MIWNSYEFFGAGGLTNSASCDILRAKTAEPPNISDTFSDRLGGIQYMVKNSNGIKSKVCPLYKFDRAHALPRVNLRSILVR